MNLKPGDQLHHYKIMSFLGRGGMGQVYKALDTKISREVAVKVLYPNLAAEAEFVRRFFREGQAVANLDHPNVIKVYEVGQQEDICFIVMEYVEGQTLRELLDEREALPVSEALNFAAQIARGLECTHAHRVLHRDIKPGNIIISTSGVAKLLDFGLARIQGVSALTLTGNVVGTIDYISPEQVMNYPVDHRSDLYSFGIVAYEMLTGLRPFTGDEAIAIVFQHINEEPLPLSAHQRNIPAEVDRLVLALLAKSPSERYASASAFLADLALCEALLKTAAEPDGDVPALLVPALQRQRHRDEFYCSLVGREFELAQMRTNIDRAFSGHGTVVLLAGNEGTGKSRLIDETLLYAESCSMWTLFGRCMYQEMVMPYQPFVDALGFRLTAGSPVENARFRSRLLGEFPEVASLMLHFWNAQERKLLAEIAPVALGPAAEQQRLFQSILRLILQMADDHGVVLCLDDLHWSDTGSVQLLHYIARQLKNRRICLIAAYRPEEVQDTSERPFSGTLRRLASEQPGMIEVTLNNLDEPSVRKLVQEIVGSRAVSVSVSDQVFRESGGNPLFAIEILKWWRDRSKTHTLNQQTLEELDEIAIAVPPRIADLILHRLNRLQDTERELLEVAAVGGVRFDVDGLATTAGTGRMDTLRQLHRLERRHSVITPAEGRYQFTHGKIQEVLYQKLPEVLRQEYHAAWGRTFLARESAGEEVPPELLANHLYAGGDGPVALPYLMKAGERAIKMYAFREAKRYWEQAHGVADDLDRVASDASMVDILLNLGRVCYELGDWDDATGHNKKAFGLAQETKNISAQAKALQQIGAVLVGRNQWSTAIQIFEQSIKLYERVGDELGVAIVHNFLGNIAYWRGEWQKAHKHYFAAMEIVEKQNDTVRIASAASNLGLVAFASGENENAINLYNKSITINKNNNNLLSLSENNANLGMVHERMEEWETSLNYHNESVQLLERLGHSRQLWIAYINYARVLARTNELSLSQEFLQKAYGILKDLKNQRGLAEAKRVDGLIASSQNNWVRAEGLFDESERLCQDAKDPYGYAETLRERAIMFQRKGDAERTIDYLKRAERAFQEIGAKGDIAVIQRKLSELEMARSKTNERNDT